mmetsp:Transcript_23391/g.92725  ORF Transcript_23391/g.92725 Transcript_23391/m.92725 type:complete len:701 (+) Transcript_23391:188-2290(+)
MKLCETARDLDPKPRPQKFVSPSSSSASGWTHSCAGVASALKSVLRGLAFGATTLVAAPLVSAYSARERRRLEEDQGVDEDNITRDGVATTAQNNASAPAGGGGSETPRGSSSGGTLAVAKSVAAGVGAGLCGAIVLPAAGVCVGVVQIARGLWNTPIAAYHALAGDKTWDASKREWTVQPPYSLPAEQAEVDAEMARLKAEEASHASDAGRHVSSMEYYDLLGVASDADAAAIKKAYYRRARACHPDKRGSSEEARAEFQKLSHAYQVLSDPRARASYDRDGASMTEASDVAAEEYDPKVFFSVLFGAQRFERFVGDLAVSQWGSALASKRGGLSSKLRKAVDAADKAAAAKKKQRGTPASTAEDDDAEDSHAAADPMAEAVASLFFESRAEYATQQRHREVSLATQLAAFLDDAADESTLETEAVALAESDFAEGSLTEGDLATALADAYAYAADAYLASSRDGVGAVLNGPLSSASNSASRAAAYVAAAAAAARGLAAVKKLHDDLVGADLAAIDGDRSAASAGDDGAGASSCAAQGRRRRPPAGAAQQHTLHKRPATRAELEAMSASALKRLARARRVDLTGCCEKGHLVDALLEAGVRLEAANKEEAPSPPPPEQQPCEATTPAVDAEAAVRDALPVFIRAMVKISIVDVQRTLDKVTAKVFDDASVADATRRATQRPRTSLVGVSEVRGHRASS